MADSILEDQGTCPFHAIRIGTLYEDVAEIKGGLKENVKKFDDLMTENGNAMKALGEKFDKLVIKVLLLVSGSLFAALIAIIWFLLQYLVTKP